MKTHEQLQNYFSSRGISTERPGFFDEPAFIKLEVTDPSVLDDYARFVQTRSMSPDELAHARRIVPLASEFLFARLLRHGRLGACIEASLTLSRFLQLQGVWNYVVKGALTVEYNKASGLTPAYLGAIMHNGNPASAGHVWVCAPPFKIVDVTASLQPFPGRGREIIGDIVVVADAVEPAIAEAQDIFEPDAVAQFLRRMGRLPTMADVRRYIPDLDEKLSTWGVNRVSADRARFKYVGLATSAPAEPLDEMTNLNLGSKSARELYEDFITTLDSPR